MHHHSLPTTMSSTRTKKSAWRCNTGKSNVKRQCQCKNELFGKYHSTSHYMSYTKTSQTKCHKSAVVWRKVLLVLEVILRYGRLKFFCSLDQKKRCFISGLEKSPDGVVFSKCDSFLFWRKVLLVQ